MSLMSSNSIPPAADAKPSATAPAAPSMPQFEASWNDETLNLAFEECLASREAVNSLAGAIESKVLAIFSVTTAVAGLVPSLKRDLGTSPASPWQTLCYLIAGLAWVYVVIQCYRAYSPSQYAITPRPNNLLDRKWLGLTPAQFRFFAIRDVGEAHEINAALILKRGWLVRAAMIATVVEIAFLGLATLAF
jgi:hypothetical protein